MASTASPRSPAPPFSDEESQETLRSKRSSIMIKCSDGSEVIFLRPNHPRSSSYATVSTSHSPSPSSGSGPSSGGSEGSGPDDKKRKGKRPVSLPAHSNVVYDSDNRSHQSHRSLPTYLHRRCLECGDLRGHSDICSIGNRLFLESLEARRLALADGEIRNDGIRTRHGHGSPRRRGISQPQPADESHSRSTSGTISQSPSSRHSETRSPRRGRSTDSRSPTDSQRAPNRIPSSQQGIQHSSSNPPTPLSRNSPNPLDLDHDSNFSSRARYSIDAVVGRSPSSRQNKIQLELRELSPHHHTRDTLPLHYFDTNMRGGHGSGAGGSGSGNRNRPRPRSGGGTGRSRSRDVLLRGLRRCCFAFSWLFGGDSEISISSRRNGYYYGRHEDRYSHSRRTRRH
ncbi:hypothetical protein EV127DRAFT_196261 [Xylaria flabelliformis]|nr:hypothetical protein EV127DRAFT_196261 [Xylaria flabelliformis]